MRLCLYRREKEIFCFPCFFVNNMCEDQNSISTLFLFVAASHQTQLDTWSKARRPIKVGIKRRGRSGTSWDSNPAGLCRSSAHLVQCEPDEASSFTNPNVGYGLNETARSSAIHRFRESPRGSKYWFSWLVRFYGISILVGYLMLNPIFTDISNIYCLKNKYVCR